MLKVSIRDINLEVDSGWRERRDLALACKTIKTAAGKLSRDVQPQANQRAKKEAEQALQRLADLVEALQ